MEGLPDRGSRKPPKNKLGNTETQGSAPLVNTTELRQLIHELNRQDPATSNFEDVVSRLRLASKDTAIPLGQCSASENFFRARVSNNKKLDRVSDLGAPPSELILGYQRCNPPDVPMFYSAAKRLTALLEIDVKPGDIVYLSQWLPKSPLPVNYVFDPQEFASRPEVSAKEVLFHSYLDTIFTRPIDVTPFTGPVPMRAGGCSQAAFHCWRTSRGVRPWRAECGL
jgi:hypothetical protein